MESLHQCGKSVEIKTQKCLGLIPKFVAITVEKLVGSPPPVTNRAKINIKNRLYVTENIRQ